VHEHQDCAIIDFQPTLGQLGNQAAQGEVLIAAAGEKPYVDGPLLARCWSVF
jgi:hypothetical protein